jgi:hypothetical protein
MSKYQYTKKGYTYRSLLDDKFDFKKSYFYQDLDTKEIAIIEGVIEEYFKDGTGNATILKGLDKVPDLQRGEENIKTVRDIIDKHEAQHKDHKNILTLSKVAHNYILDNYYSYNPTVFECHFFPNPSNEVKIANMLRTVKKKMDIAIFSLSNDTLYEAIKEVWEAGCEVRVIADDECCKNFGSDIYKLAALGIPVKTDDSEKFHMHHKFAVIDESLVVTGSFNWTSQAVSSNQENILFLENKGLAKQYTDEYNHLWDTFQSKITKEDAIKLIAEQKNNRKY